MEENSPIQKTTNVVNVVWSISKTNVGMKTTLSFLAAWRKKNKTIGNTSKLTMKMKYLTIWETNTMMVKILFPVEMMSISKDSMI